MARLSALDAAMLAIETPQAPMHVGWAATFAPPAGGRRPEFEAVREHIAARLPRAPRYRQRLAQVPLGLGDPVWVDDPGFDIARHVRHAPPGNFGELVDEVMSAPLAAGQPLWELWIADQLEDGQIGVVGKAHHCLVDGLGAVELMSLLLDLTPDPEVDEPAPWQPAPQPGALQLVADSVAHRLGQGLDVARQPLDWVRAPARAAQVPGQLRRTAQAALHAALPPAPPSRLNGPMSTVRHLAWTSRPLEDLRVIKQQFGTTINDVLLAACAGAVRALALEDGENPSDLKAMVPVSVRDPQEGWGNRIAFLFVALPCTEPDPLRRLRKIHRATQSGKNARAPEGADALLGVLALAPLPVRRVTARVLASPLVSNLTISNIPGPRDPVYLMGCEVGRAYPVVPLTNNHGLSIGLTTVSGQACFSVYAQIALAGDADRLARGIDVAIGELLEGCEVEAPDAAQAGASSDAES